MHRNKSVNVHQFSMVPRADIPRSSFRIQTTHKTTFDSGYLVPVYCDEILPGDTFSVKMTAFARLATPIVPIMDNVYLDSFFFFVPCRLLWTNWQKFMGEQTNPGDSISYTVPQLVSTAGGYAINSIFDYFGLPTAGQVTAGQTVSHNVLPLRAYNQIYNEWFRDENLINSVYEAVNDGPDSLGGYGLLRRGKRHDYFTSALPWVQKGAAVSIPLGSTAPVKALSTEHTTSGTNVAPRFRDVSTNNYPTTLQIASYGTNGQLGASSATTASSAALYPSNLYADLSTAMAATINQLRQSFQIQKLLERDARGGTRYTEVIRAHFGVISPDARLQRPEYLGGGSSYVNISAIAQQSATGLTGGTTPQGNLSAIGHVTAHGHGFTQSFTEHGYVIGLVNVRADLTYQQGLRKMWSRSTRYDFYFPVFAMLGEQAIYNREIWCKGDGTASDSQVFGYQERWAEYRYNPSLITGLFRSTAAGTLDIWHLAQNFSTLPTLNQTFIEENPPISRILATASTGKQWLFDAFFDIKAARPLPMYSVPGLIDHF